MRICSAKSIRKPRADAVRNRERVLEAAKAVFSAGGPEASLEAVAKRAGVGIGTPYRQGAVRGGLPARGRTAQRAGRAVEGRKGSGRRAPALAPLQCRIRRHQE